MSVGAVNRPIRMSIRQSKLGTTLLWMRLRSPLGKPQVTKAQQVTGASFTLQRLTTQSRSQTFLTKTRSVVRTTASRIPAAGVQRHPGVRSRTSLHQAMRRGRLRGPSASEILAEQVQPRQRLREPLYSFVTL